jgi:DNA adenine methylase
MSVTRPALRYHGGKFRLAPWILQFFPPHGCYVEPFGGAAGVLLRKPRVYAEVYNDLDGEIVNFFRVLRDPTMRADLVEACRLTPYARDEFDLAYEPTDDALERARRTCVRAAMGFGSAGATKATTGFRTDTRRKYGTAQHNWADYPAALGAIGERFTGVLVENRDAIEVIQAHDSDDVLCGYATALYDLELEGWARHETSARISGGRGTSLRTEVVWLNPACSAALHRPRDGLFAEHA